MALGVSFDGPMDLLDGSEVLKWRFIEGIDIL